MVSKEIRMEIDNRFEEPVYPISVAKVAQYFSSYPENVRKGRFNNSFQERDTSQALFKSRFRKTQLYPPAINELIEQNRNKIIPSKESKRVVGGC